MDQQRGETHRPLVQRLWLPLLLIVPGLLAVLTVIVLFIYTIHSDLNIPALYSQCHAHARLHALSRLHVIGPPACFIVSFFQLANEPVRSAIRMSVMLSFAGALLTVSLVESARMCNRRSRVVSSPTVPWLVFNLGGGALAWQLVLVPAFLRQARRLQSARVSGRAEQAREADPDIDREVRGLSSQLEAYAIPVAVVLGFVVPSVLMLALNRPVLVAVWLFFPLWVALVRYSVKLIGVRVVVDPQPYHLESHRLPLLCMYAVPTVWSAVSHILLIWNLFGREDRTEETMTMIKFLQIDIGFVALTVLYWLWVEAGAIVAAAAVAVSILLGPGAGLSGAWVLREKTAEAYPTVEVSGEDSTERTALLHEEGE